jgi:hypothetical protein
VARQDRLRSPMCGTSGAEVNGSGTFQSSVEANPAVPIAGQFPRPEAPLTTRWSGPLCLLYGSIPGEKVSEIYEREPIIRGSSRRCRFARLESGPGSGASAEPPFPPEDRLQNPGVAITWGVGRNLPDFRRFRSFRDHPGKLFPSLRTDVYDRQ